MGVKIFLSLVIIVVTYTLGVFLAPVLTDDIGAALGISSVNTTIRTLKSGVDSTSDTLLQMKDASGAINHVRGIVQQANTVTEQTTETINNLRQATEQKVQQVQKTADSIRKASEAISAVQNNVSELTNFSGSISASGEIKTGTGK